MKMQQAESQSLWSTLAGAKRQAAAFLYGVGSSAAFDDLVRNSVLNGQGDALRGSSVLILTSNQLIAAHVFAELDGIARRLVLYPSDFPLEHLRFVIETADVDAIVSDRTDFGPTMPRVRFFVPYSRESVPQDYDRSSPSETEWILLTSGTSGLPKLVAHTFASLTSVIKPTTEKTPRVWSTFYDVRRYGGLQILLRALLTGSSMVLSDAAEPLASLLERAGSHGVTHISGTPSHWRRALMSNSAHRISPQYVRLSGEIADQAILNQLGATYPDARLVHAFASTEAGLAFEVNDALAGFPENAVGHTPRVEMKIEYHSLRVRSAGTAKCYLGNTAPVLKDEAGYVDTGDLLELRDGRYYFVGRRDGQINVGGLKVYPEEIEAVLNRHPEVYMSLVKWKKSPVMGAVVVADVVLKAALQAGGCSPAELKDKILVHCRSSLSPYKVPAVINFVPALEIAQSGKLRRAHA
jgi:acyl-coenzyme A synthetase/AMP-(fatty) acid ligase